MQTSTVKRKGRCYTILAETKEGKLTISVNSEELSNVYYNEKRKVWFAPYVCEQGNFWVVVYNNKLYLSSAPSELTVAEFEKRYLRRAYILPVSILLILSAIVIPEFLYMVFTVVYDLPYSPNVLLMICPLFYYFVVNAAPITTVKKRRLLCLVIYGYVLLTVMMAVFGLMFK